jgi:hypothetical protein
MAGRIRLKKQKDYGRESRGVWRKEKQATGKQSVIK